MKAIHSQGLEVSRYRDIGDRAPIGNTEVNIRDISASPSRSRDLAPISQMELSRRGARTCGHWDRPRNLYRNQKWIRGCGPIAPKRKVV